jgi:hypothetical protein
LIFLFECVVVVETPLIFHSNYTLCTLREEEKPPMIKRTGMMRRIGIGKRNMTRKRKYAWLSVT